MSGAPGKTGQLQIEFWRRFSEALDGSSFPQCAPAAKNWRYLPIATSRAVVVAVVHFRMGRVGCKLAMRHSRLALPRDQAEIVYEALFRDRVAIERELGFSDLEWGDPTGTRIYRYADAALEDADSWPAAHEWLISCAERFKQVFAPRIGQLDLPGTNGVAKAFATVDGLGPWSRWTPIDKAREVAPRLPGVYMARTGRRGPVIYVGMAGER